eukprot:m.222338 g.222338  ORF g.222338 m.222338 type:complete len:1048 (+) comp33371_c0_seq6:308-3451(+)
MWLSGRHFMFTICLRLSTVFVQGCVFDCRIGSFCGGNDVQYINQTFKQFLRLAKLNTLDLSNRGITEVPVGGLDCYFETTLVDIDDDNQWFDNFNDHQTQAILLDNNVLTAIPDMETFRGTQVISFSNNTISEIAPAPFAGFLGLNTTLTVYLDNNQISLVSRDLFANFSGQFMAVHLDYNNITTLEPGLFTEFSGFQLVISLPFNTISTLVPRTFACNTKSLFVYLENNTLNSIEEGAFSGFNGSNLVVYLDNNSLTSLVHGTFSGFGADSLDVQVRNNKISSVGAIFQGYTGSSCDLSLYNNEVPSASLKAMLDSFESGLQIHINLAYNNITELPNGLFLNVAITVVGGDIISLNLSHNPITLINEFAFKRAPQNAFFGNILSIEIDMSNPTNGKILCPATLSFENVAWSAATGGSVRLDLTNSGVNLSMVNALSGSNAPHILEIILSHNNISYVAPYAFENSRVSYLDLSNNHITIVSARAFVYNQYLSKLDLSNNLLAVVENQLVSNSPFASLAVSNNMIWAVPLVRNNIINAAAGVNNVIVCSSYGPELTQASCTCTDGLVYSEHCGYGRCMSTRSGCSGATFVNATDCKLAPFSTCLSACPEEQYYDYTTGSCLPVTDCATEFPNPGGKFSLAYQVNASTATANRRCSICSSCPDGYHTVLCTPTSNARCTRSGQLSSGDIAAIIFSVLLAAMMGFVGWVYGRTQLKRQTRTQGELELSELLLGDVTEEKERMTEENRLMQQAWTIDESDLQIHEMIGNGAYGTVFSSTWGHIPVAVKVLKVPLDDLDPIISEDFDREVTFMQSIRHPNLLTFFGAGVNNKSQAFLVTELMDGGSLRVLLLNATLTLTWEQRVSFAKDIARGMKYLHEKETIHRDLKADNCFVDGNLRVKVADFGTGKIQSKFQSPTQSDFASTVIGEGGGRTLTKGMGSLLWMAPEVLRGENISPELGFALDVYSFGMVMWEIWARARPWDEVEGDEANFLTKLSQLVNDGHRPRLPASSGTPPQGYSAVMKQCWATRASERPSFEVTLANLESPTMKAA